MTNIDASKQKPHPMIKVPDAIRIVLEETAKVLMEEDGAGWIPRVAPTKCISVSGLMSFEEIIGTTLSKDVIMSEPGYPSYNVSIMDGYAIKIEKKNSDDNKHRSKKIDPTEEKKEEEIIWTHRVIDKIFAGNGDGHGHGGDDDETTKTATIGSTEQQLASSYYVTTGAVIPDTYDCVVPIEEVKISSTKKKIQIKPSSMTKKWKWIRPIGCDIIAGSVVLPKGHVIDAISLGLIHQSGAAEIEIINPITVGVLSTGNELVNVSSNQKTKNNSSTTAQQRKHGQIPDVNRPVLLAQLSSMGISIKIIDLGIQRDDDVEALTESIKAALQYCQVIVTTGGVSMGETDIVEHVLVDRLGGTLHFGRMHMKPGKPTTFVTIPTTTSTITNKKEEGGATTLITTTTTRLVFAMPGNPVSATVCTHLVVSPCLHLLFHGRTTTENKEDTIVEDESNNEKEQQQCRHNNTKHHLIEKYNIFAPEIKAILMHDINLDPRPEYRRVQLKATIEGRYEATSTGVQRSSRLMSMRDAQGLMVLPPLVPTKTKALKGEFYTVILLSNDGKNKRTLCHSFHMNPPPPPPLHSIAKKKPVLRIGIMQAVVKSSSLPLHASSQIMTTTDLSNRVNNCFIGGQYEEDVMVSSSRTYYYSDTENDDISSNTKEENSTNKNNWENFVSSILDIKSDGDDDDVDIIVVSCPSASIPGSFQYYLDLTFLLRQRLTKVAESLAQVARRGAASQHAQAALFDAVVGFVPGCGSSADIKLVICLPESGLDTALINVRNLLVHALKTARNSS